MKQIIWEDGTGTIGVFQVPVAFLDFHVGGFGAALQAVFDLDTKFIAIERFGHGYQFAPGECAWYHLLDVITGELGGGQVDAVHDKVHIRLS